MPRNSTGRPQPLLSQFDAVAMIVGVVVGAGIFRLPSLVAGNVDAEWMIVAVWVAGGVISLIGALCFAELISTHPHPGGEYHFLKLAYGRDFGFMYAWARMTVIQTGSIALLAFIFADYATQLVPLGRFSVSIYAALAVIMLTGLNIIGLRQSKAIQNMFFAATLIGLGLIVAGGVFVMVAGGLGPTEPAQPVSAGGGALGLAMVFVLLTYGGWNEAAYISAELRDGPASLVRALILAIAIITALYVAANLVFLGVLDHGGMAASEAPASDLMRVAFGETGAAITSLLIVVVVIASVNVTIITGARTNYALGRDFAPFRALGSWRDGPDAPVRALLLQAAIALVLIGAAAWNRTGIQTAVDYLTPVFWLFFLMTGLSIFVLRYRSPALHRPFRVPFYPLTPVLFCLTSAYLLYASINYTGQGALYGVAVLAMGLPFIIWRRLMEPRAALAATAYPIPSTDPITNPSTEKR
jgi:APA family basic amino acid/polyamine antiporter